MAAFLRYLLNEDAACVSRCYESPMNGARQISLRSPWLSRVDILSRCP
jgi:hypothetical protein